MKINLIFFCFLFCLLSLFASAEDERPCILYAPVPSWVEKVPFEDLIEKNKDGDSRVYSLLVDQQIKKEDEIEYFYHFVNHLLTEEDVNNGGTLDLIFSPQYETLTFHEINVWRGKEKINKLDSDTFQLLQREMNLESLLVDGRWTALGILEDVRKGDVLEYSYSLKGQNPAFEGHFQKTLYLEYLVPVERIFFRLLWPLEKDLFLCPVNYSGNIPFIAEKDLKIFRFQRDSVEARVTDSECPPWFNPFGRVNFSSLGSWKEVAAWASPKFKLDEAYRDKILELVFSLVSDEMEPHRKVMACLNYVQNEIRYLGIEISSNGYNPHPAKETLKNRFGDCKDKVLLLLEMLNVIGIQAWPVLVNTTEGPSLSDDGPSMGAFDHAIAKVQLGEKHYWLDPTLNFQEGALDHISQSDYGYALVLSPETEELESMEQDLPTPDTVVKTSIDLRKGINKEGTLQVQTTYFGREAERIKAKLGGQEQKALEKRFLNYYCRYYNNVEKLEEMQVLQEGSQVTLLEKYSAPKIWRDEKDEGRYVVYVYGDSILDYLVKPQVYKRSSPFVLSHPVHVEQKLALLLPKHFTLDPQEKVIENKFFRLFCKVSYDKEKEEADLHYIFKSYVDHVLPEDLSFYLDEMAKADDQLTYTLYSSYDGLESDSGDISDSEAIIFLFVFLALGAIAFLLLVATVVEWTLDRGRAPSPKADFYAVSPLKFFILSTFSMGLYQIYWLAKNWIRVRAWEGSRISVVARVVFPYFWFNSLYLKANEALWDQDVEPFPLVERKTRYLPFLFFLSSVTAFLPYAIIPSVILSSLCLVPYVQRINMVYPKGHPDFDWNSQWKLRHGWWILFFIVYVFILLILPHFIDTSLL